MSLLDMLVQGVDARGTAPYGLSVPAGDGLVHFGSCTANPITAATFARADSVIARRAWLDPATHLRALFGAAQCVLAASGTDAQYTCSLAMEGEPHIAILMDPNEIGGGCTRAAAGVAHALGCPVTQALPVHATIETTCLRDESGQAMAAKVVDQQVFDIASRHPHMPLLLHHVPCSKTGLSAPSEAACLSLELSHGAGVRVVVDASQGRFELADVRRWLGYGWVVMITGSKYFGAPPFCGATLLPSGWPKARGFAVGPGVMARWRLALDAMAEAGPSSLKWLQALQDGFVPPMPDMWVDRGAELARQGIVSFDVGLDAERTLRLHRTLIQRGFFIGQPVRAGARHLLRVALGAQTPMGTAASDLNRLALAIQRELRHG